MSKISLKPKILIFIICLFSLIATANSVLAGSEEIKWNNEHIRWQEYEHGLNYARQTRKPVILIFYTNWCPTCKKYAYVFQDNRVVAESDKFIMIRLNRDNNKELSLKYGFDGVYIPRTIALYPDGKVMHEIYHRKNYRYYIGTDADNLLKLMKDAYARLQ